VFVEDSPMNRVLSQRQAQLLGNDPKTYRKLELNYRKNKTQDHTASIDSLAAAFRYEDCQDMYWNPERFSLLYGTPLWEQATSNQRITLNQLYWVAYYSQIISAEIATIFFNQTSAAGLYALEDFRLVCDTLDLESAQERAHIHAFKTVGEGFEEAVFGKRLFTYAMRSPFVETMIHHQARRAQQFWRQLQLHAFALLSASNAFIACQYFAVRGVRTLNGKLIQHQLSQYYTHHADREHAPIPAKISYYHFLDESFHFNSSTIISHDVLHALRQPTRFERWVANRTLLGTQRDHYHFSTAVNGLFWYDPACYPKIYTMLRSQVFGMDHRQAREIMWACFGEESEGLHLSEHSRQIAINSYREYLADLPHVNGQNKDLALMRRNSVGQHLACNRRALHAFFQGLEVRHAA